MQPQGLSSEEVKKRKVSGRSNDTDDQSSRSYLDILIKNLATPFNLILFILGALLIVMPEKPDYINAMAATGVILFNVLISTIQEMKAKRRLDKIALLMRPKVKVMRDGRIVEIDRSDIVMDDAIYLSPGDQAQVDGIIVDERMLEMDESLLTGESSTRRKHEGDTVYSGSYCISGECWFIVNKVGEDTFSSKMLRSAKKFEKKKTPLQVETNAVTEMLMILAFIFLALLVVLNIFRNIDVVDSLRQAVIVLDIVPIALFLLITLTYMIAAVRMADSGVLLQNSSSVESMSHVDTVCMDKTGTITTNNLVFNDIDYISADRGEVDRLVKEFVSTTGSRNRTIIAIEDKYGKGDYELDDEVQFSSDRKFSAVRVKNGDSYDTIIMGAWPFLKDHVKEQDGIEEKLSALSSKGLRSVVFLSGGSAPLHSGEDIVLPDLTVLAVISIIDEVRPDCKEILQQFSENGIDIKVISGDDPETVDAIFKIADIPGERKIISGEELSAMSPEEYEKTVVETNIFGRMRPEQKEKVIETLRKKDKYVAMVGDGINDVRSIKQAQVGVAVQSGSGAARSVADMVLVNDNFMALPKAIIEGKRTVSGMRDILKLYLMRNFTLAFLVLVLLLFLNKTPLLPIQNTVYAFLTVSIAAFLMTLWAKPSDNKDLVLPSVMRYVIPTAITTTVLAFAVYCVFYNADFDIAAAIAGMVENSGWSEAELRENLGINGSGWDEIVGRNAMIAFLILAGISQLFILFPISKRMSIDGKRTSDWKPLALGLLLFGVVIALYNYPDICIKITYLFQFPMELWAIIITATAIWFVVTLLILRSPKLNRLSDWIDSLIRNHLKKNFEKESAEAAKSFLNDQEE